MTTWFDSDFELGTGDADWAANGWVTDYGNLSTGLGIASDQAFSPTRSVKGTWTDVNGSASQPQAYKTFAAVDRFYARWMQRVSSGFQIGSNGSTKQPRWYCDGTGFTTIMVKYYGAGSSTNFEYRVEMEHIYGGFDNFGFSTGIAPRANQWDQLEIYTQMNAPGVADGIVKFWVNGVLAVNQMALEIRGPLLTSTDLFNTGGFACPSNETWTKIDLFVQSGVGNVWYDRIAMGDTAPVSLIGGADTTPPAIPTGVTVS